MEMLFDSGSDLLNVFLRAYVYLFETPLNELPGLGLVLGAAGNAFGNAGVIASSVMPDVGISGNNTLADLIIGGGLIGIVIFKLVKYFVGIVTGS